MLIESGAQREEFEADGDDKPQPRRYSVDLLPTQRRLPDIHRTSCGTLSLKPKLSAPPVKDAATADAAPPVIPPQRYRQPAVQAPAVEQQPALMPEPTAQQESAQSITRYTPALTQAPQPQPANAQGDEDKPAGGPITEEVPAPRRRYKFWVRCRVMYRRTEGARRWLWRVGRRGLVLLLTGMFIAAVWTPRLLWWGVSGGVVHTYRITRSAVVFSWGVLSDAARATPVPERNPLMPRPIPRSAEQTKHQTDATASGDAAQPRLRPVDVAPPYRPVVFMYPPKSHAEVQAKSDLKPAAPERVALPPHTDPGTDKTNADAAPTQPVETSRLLNPSATQRRTDRQTQPTSPARNGIAPAPSSVREPDIVDTPPPFQSTGWEIGILSAGLRNLVLAVVGATLSFMVGSVLFMGTPGPAVMVGVLLMIGGVGGLLLTLVQLNEWLAGLKHELTPPTRLGIRALGMAGAACLLAAFAVTTLPRGIWPI